MKEYKPAAAPLPPHPLALLAAAPATALALARDYDAYGDSYTQPTDRPTLDKCFTKISIDEPDVYLTAQEMLELDKELFGNTNPYSFLRPCFMRLVNCKTVNEIYSKMFGATVCDASARNVTHVVVGKTTGNDEINNLREMYKDALIVSEDWLEECAKNEMLIPEDTYTFRTRVGLSKHTRRLGECFRRSQRLEISDHADGNPPMSSVPLLRTVTGRGWRH
ncbi:hypothetical protein O3G_MSEX010718 [Manduca sexta]|uniref:BRCT domain-containing protein n=1 Tax=Manduca sexta TaxID=7130 RepID=A0A922CTU0_MANSE|nr:hypothetical protein O3G_MSEX010718 [Manduca sexta]